MNNNESKKYNREVRQDSYTDAEGNTYSNVTRTSETVENNPDTYQDGYVSGRMQEQNYQRRDLAARDSNNTTNGLFLGILLAALATLVGGAMWYFSQYREAENATPTPIETPVSTDSNNNLSEPEVVQPPQNNTTTIIEKTKEVAVPVEVPVPVPVPQQQAPVPEPQQRDVNINVQPQEGAAGSNSIPQNQTVPNQSQSSNGSSNSSSQSQQPKQQTSSTSTSNSPNTSESNSNNSPQ